MKQFSILEFNNELEVLTQTFVVNENGTYHNMHDKLFDFLAYYFGTKYNRLLIKHADMHLINDRCVIIDPGKSDDTKSEEYVIAIQDDNLQSYTERVFEGMTKADDEMRLLKSNRNEYNKTFQYTLWTILKNLKKNQISKLIQIASSVFVRDMFVMDVNDIKTDNRYSEEPYGIFLDYDHLEKYIERMFIDMTKSDDIEFYIERSRCCRNEAFCTDLLTYMTILSSTKIKELIKSASTSFVQLMFVMEKDDIKLSAPPVYTRYGIVVPGDVIQVYIERVFDDITKSEDVNK